MTVVRRWEAKVARGDLGDWAATFRQRVLPNVRKIDGFESVTFLAGQEDDPAPVTVLMRWRDMEAINRFAGEDPAKTVLPDFMERFFTDYDARATFHDELLLETK